MLNNTHRTPLRYNISDFFSSLLGPYEILTAIGAGGMGEVYQAHDTKLGRDVGGFLALNPRLQRAQEFDESFLIVALQLPKSFGYLVCFAEVAQDGVA